MSATDPKTSPESWPRKLNKALMAVGIIALGLFVTDRVLDTFSSDESVPQQAQRSGSESVTESTNLAAQSQPDSVDDDATLSLINTDPVASLAVSDTAEQADVPLELESLFGSKVVFVSASEPAYLVTADERRFDVGSAVDDETTLAGLTAQQIVFEQSGDLIVISLPEPAVQ